MAPLIVTYRLPFTGVILNVMSDGRFTAHRKRYNSEEVFKRIGMSVRPFQSGFLQRLKYEDEVLKQVANVVETFNSGILVDIMNSVDSLEDLIDGIPEPEGLKEYQEDMNKLSREFEKSYAVKLSDWEEEVRDIGCPDVIDKPRKIPDLLYFRRKKRLILRLLAQNKLTILPKNIQHL